MRCLIVALFFMGVAAGQTATELMGRAITINEPKHDEFGFTATKSSASVCLAGPPQKQCFAMPENYASLPSATVIQLKRGQSALLFAAQSAGVSGWAIDFALLQPGNGAALRNLFPADLSVSNQSEHSFWDVPDVSDMPLFMTADYVWGLDDGHYGSHRFMISVYRGRFSQMMADFVYELDDRYMTARKYDSETSNILTSEKAEILARLRRIDPSRK